MNHVFKFYCIVSLLFVVSTAFSQSTVPQNPHSKQPVLIDDKHAESLKMAKENFDNQLTSSNSVWKSLTEKQKNKITQIESVRESALKKNEAQITAKKGYLKTLELFSSENAHVIEKTKSEIAKLAVERQKIKVRFKKKIRSQFTAVQRAIYDKKD